MFTVNKHSRKVNTLNEERIDHMSDKETKLKNKLYKLLKDDGKGHFHAAYAERLKRYDVNIVPHGKEPSTAAISFDEAIIYINEDFLVADNVWLEKKRNGENVDKYPPTFYQLNVLMRHELSHDLMMHQIRMMHHITNIPWSHLKMSHSLHDIINIIEDFEISNRRYSDEDKDIVRHMWLNGQLISGLVTEDHRESWQDLPLEQMYNALVAEYDAGGGDGYLYKATYTDKTSPTLNMAAGQLNATYADISSYSEADSVAEFKNMLRYDIRKANHDSKLDIPPEWAEVIDKLDQANLTVDNGCTTADIEQLLYDIKASGAFKPFDVISPISGELIVTLYTPEERWLAIEVLKILEGNTEYNHDFKVWEKTVKETVQKAQQEHKLSADDIKTLLSAVS